MALLPNRQPAESDLESWPVQSPFENTRNVYCALSRHADTKLYHLAERVRCHFRKEDVFLGHPYFPHQEGRYGVTELAARESPRPRLFALISPLHCDVSIGGTHINKEFLDDIGRLLPHADVLFGIMGEYWWKQWDSSPYAAWKAKMIRLDMALDVRRYPRVKWSFNKPGHRGYLYIGMNEPRKGTDLLSRLMVRLGDFPRGWIGSGPGILGVPKVSEHRALTPDFMEQVATKFDFFVSPSRADPNPTTILESMAWGFPVACTPQSGYRGTSYRWSIFHEDIRRSVSVLEYLQYADERELLRAADEARSVVETQYSWDRFTSSIISGLDLREAPGNRSGPLR